MMYVDAFMSVVGVNVDLVSCSKTSLERRSYIVTNSVALSTMVVREVVEIVTVVADSLVV